MRVIATATTITQAFKNAGRVREILGVLGKHGFAEILHRMKLTRFLPTRYSERPRFQHLPPQERLRMSFEELGPTFVKLGQLMATRPDLIPEAYVEEFEKLQDKVPGVSFTQIREAIEKELKTSMSSVFAEFDEVPIAAASIAQVHRATLVSGERVAVKVQRPDIEKQIVNDVSILRGLAILLEKYIPESKVLNPTGLVEEFFRTILWELDFRVEANNIRRIKRNLAELEKISIPEVYTRFSTERLLALQLFEGIRFSDREAIIAAGIDPVEIVKLGTDAFFHMVMKDGLFHGDLHAGNLFVMKDSRIGIIDFGIVGRLTRRVRDSIIIMFTAIVDEDFDTLASEYVSLCQSTGMTDVGLLQKDLMDSISPYIGMALGEVNIGKVLLRSTSVATKHNLQVPRELMLLFRAILTIEALGKKLDPNFDLLPAGIRLARQTISNRYSKERVMHDLILVGRDVQRLMEITPRLMKRYLHHWEQNHFAFEVRNKDTRALASVIRQSSQTALLCVLCIGMFSVGVTLLFMDRAPQVFGISLFALIALAFATIPLIYRLWYVRRHSR